MLEAAESAAGPVLPSVDRWRLRDVEYSAVFSDGLDPDPAVVRAIRAFDPEYVPLLVRRVHNPDLGIGMGKRDLAQSALGMLVEHACFDTGLRQPMQEQICLGQVRGGAQPEHGRVIEPAR